MNMYGRPSRISFLVASMVLSASAVTFADGPMMGNMQGSDMQGMDQNHDGMISKAEFMQYHEKMWAEMEKNDHGMFVVKPQPMQPPAKGMGGMKDM